MYSFNSSKIKLKRFLFSISLGGTMTVVSNLSKKKPYTRRATDSKLSNKKTARVFTIVILCQLVIILKKIRIMQFLSNRCPLTKTALPDQLVTKGNFCFITIPFHLTRMWVEWILSISLESLFLQGSSVQTSSEKNNCYFEVIMKRTVYKNCPVWNQWLHRTLMSTN